MVSKTPQLPGLFYRLNRLAPAFQALAEHWLSVIGVGLCEHREYIVDSCPIILAKGSRSGVRELPANCARKPIIPLGISGIMACNFMLLLPAGSASCPFPRP